MDDCLSERCRPLSRRNTDADRTKPHARLCHCHRRHIDTRAAAGRGAPDCGGGSFGSLGSFMQLRPPVTALAASALQVNNRQSLGGLSAVHARIKTVLRRAPLPAVHDRSTLNQSPELVDRCQCGGTGWLGDAVPITSAGAETAARSSDNKRLVQIEVSITNVWHRQALLEPRALNRVPAGSPNGYRGGLRLRESSKASGVIRA